MLELKHNKTPSELSLLRIIKRLPNYTKESISKLSLKKLLTLRDTTFELKSKVEQYIRRKRTHAQQHTLPLNLLKELLDNSSRTLKLVNQKINNKTVAHPRPAGYSPAKGLLRKSEDATRNQVLNKKSTAQINHDLRSQSLNVRIPIQTARSKASRPITEISRVETTNPILRILGKLLIALAKRKIVSLRSARKAHKMTQKEIEAAIRELNLLFGSNIFSRAIRLKERGKKSRKAENKAEEKAKVAYSKVSQKSNEPGAIVFKIKYDGKGNIVGIEIVGRIKENEAVSAAKKATNIDPKEMVPLLTEAAVEAVQNNPKSTFAVLDFVAQALSRNLENTPVSIAPNQALTPSRAMEMVVGKVVQTLISKPGSPIDLSASVKERIEIAHKVLEKYHSIALPILLQMDSSQSVKGLIQKLAQTTAVQNHIIDSARVKPDSQLIAALSASAAGRAVIVQTAQSLVTRANTKATAKTLTSKIVRSIGLVNPEKFGLLKEVQANPSTAQFAIARELLTTVSRAKQINEKIKVPKPKTQPRRKTNYYGSKFQSLPKKPKINQRLMATLKKLPAEDRTELRRSAEELVRTSKNSSNLLIPETLIKQAKQLQAGVAALAPPAIAQNAPASIEAPRATPKPVDPDKLYLEHLERSLKADPLNAIAKETPSALDKTKALMIRAETLIFRLVAERVKDPKAILAEIIKIKKQLKLANTSIRQIAEAIKSNKPTAYVPVYNADLVERNRQREKKEELLAA